jgi:hypothetical protein
MRRQKLAVQVAQVQQRHLAEWGEAEKLGLAQPLLPR